MKGIALLFFVSGVLCLLGGMGLGIYMGIVHDHTLSPVHAHINLVGFVLFALMGLFYHATPEAAATLGARIHFGLATVGLLCMVPGIAYSVQGYEEGVALAIVGSLSTLAAVLTFLINLAITKAKVGRGHRHNFSAA